MTDDRLPDAVRLREAGALERARELLLELRAERPENALLLVETTSDPAIRRHRRALTGYARDLDRSWLAG